MLFRSWFGFLEAEDPETTGALLRQVEAWAAAREVRVVRGPANPSLNESAGLLVTGFDSDPAVMMPYNPPEYETFVERAGYAEVKDLLAWTIDATLPLGARMARIAARIRGRHGITVRPLEMRRFDRDLAHLTAIYRAAWQDNWGFVPPTDAEIRQLAVDLRPVLDPEIAVFAEMGERVVGCAIAIPDVNQVLKKMNGNLLPFGLWHFLRRKSIVDRARVILLGVLPEVRHLGLYPLLVADLFTRGAARGYRSAELSWTLEDNDEINVGIEAAGGRRTKVYRLFGREDRKSTRLNSSHRT